MEKSYTKLTLWRKLEHDLSVQKKVLACTYWNMIRKLLKVFFYFG